MKKLYYEDSEQISFEAEVRSCEPTEKGNFLVTLSQTAFYPEGGGQPCDTGQLGGVSVLDVQEKGGEIFHTTSGPLKEGTMVLGTLDWERRFGYMQNHSGEHILSGIIHQNFGYDNVGFHMGSDEITIDFNGKLTKKQLLEAEAKANEIVFQNVPIIETYPDQEALAALDYRSKKPLTGAVRIIRIPGGDVCACCGTHVKTTGAIGIIKVTGMINYKGGVRITMLCGKDALADYQKRLDQVAKISHLLSAKADQITGAVENLKEEAAKKDYLIQQLYQQIFEARAAALPESDQVLCLFEEGLDPVQLRKFCTLLYEQKKGRIVAVCSLNGTAYQFALGSQVQDMRKLGQELNQRLSGRGGGSSLMIQGMWNATREDITAALL